MFKKLASDAGRLVLKELVEVREGDDANLQDTFYWIFTRLAAVVIVMNSSEDEIDIQKYTQLCKDVSVKIVESFSWARMSESIHRILAHSPELIASNNNKGLGGHSEEVLALS